LDDPLAVMAAQYVSLPMLMTSTIPPGMGRSLAVAVTVESPVLINAVTVPELKTRSICLWVEPDTSLDADVVDAVRLTVVPGAKGSVTILFL
jgi:hypothetical protein